MNARIVISRRQSGKGTWLNIGWPRTKEIRLEIGAKKRERTGHSNLDDLSTIREPVPAERIHPPGHRVKRTKYEIL
jgi:hypothetical protein